MLATQWTDVAIAVSAIVTGIATLGLLVGAIIAAFYAKGQIAEARKSRLAQTAADFSRRWESRRATGTAGTPAIRRPTTSATRCLATTTAPTANSLRPASRRRGSPLGMAKEGHDHMTGGSQKTATE